MAYYGDVSLISAWCELRQDFRSFRVDRILSSQLLDEHFSPEQGRLTAAWHALSKEAPGGPSAGSKVAKGANPVERALAGRRQQGADTGPSRRCPGTGRIDRGRGKTRLQGTADRPQ
jgi:predicted DNA-binding transcriptional regulator YafY